MRKRFKATINELAPDSLAPPRHEMARKLRDIREAARGIAFSLVPSRDHKIRGIWFFRNSPTDWEKLMQQLSDYGLNSVFARVSRSGSAIYKSDVLPQVQWAVKAGGDELQKAIDAAHRHDIDFHAWRVNFHEGSASKNFYDRLAKKIA